MDQNILSEYCENQYRLFQIPIHIFKNGKRIKTFDLRDSVFNEGQEMAILKQFHTPEKRTRLHYLPSLLMDGAVFSEEEDLFVYFGYVRCSDADRETVRTSILQELTDPSLLTDELLENSVLYLKRMPRMNPGRFAALLSSVYLFLNGKPLLAQELYCEELKEERQSYVESYEKEELFEEERSRAEYESMQLILFYVRHGMYVEIEKMCRKGKSFNVFGSEKNRFSWRKVKNGVLQGVALLAEAAIQAGGDLTQWFRIRREYTERVELAEDLVTLNRIRYSMLIDFSKRVFFLKYRAVEEEDISAVVQYVQEHVEEKISLDDIAENIHMSKSRLCTKFRQYMGICVSDFIRERKVEKAKQLLRFTSLSLVEIANELSYSSQSYFQQVFRNQTGQTPAEYRNRHAKE